MSRRRQCAREIKIEGIPALTVYCCLGEGHIGACEIDLLGSDDFNEWLFAMAYLPATLRG